MRVERIELENWMSYPRVWQDVTGECRPAIDLSGHPLILIAGENGAGKSAILEAICYALFAKYPRGSANNEAIRSSEKKAIIRLYFSIPGHKENTIYCVERELSQTQTSASLHRVEIDTSKELTKRNKILIIDKQQQVTDYIKDKLLQGITYETFVSSVFLRQQETGRFMGLAHGDQRIQLLSLCRLDIYDRIYSEAIKRRKHAEELISLHREEFSKVEYASDEKLQEQERFFEQTKWACTEAERQRVHTHNIFENTHKAEDLYRRIEEIRTRLLNWHKVLEKKGEIEYAIFWQEAWNRIRPVIQRGWNTLDSILKQETDFKTTHEACELLRDELKKIEIKYRSLQESVEALREQYRKIVEEIDFLAQQENRLREQLQIAQRANELDGLIARTNIEQEARQQELKNFKQIEQQYKYLLLLQQTKSVLNDVISDLRCAANEEEIAKQLSANIDQLEQETNKNRVLLNQTEAEITKIEEELNHTRVEYSSIERELNTLTDKLDARRSALDAGQCPTCGLEMTGDIGSHVHKYALQLQSQIVKQTEFLDNLSQQIGKLNEKIVVQKNETKYLEMVVLKVERQAEQAKRDELQAKKQITTFNQRAHQRWDKFAETWHRISVPDWLKSPSIDTQKQVDLAIIELSPITEQYERLHRLQIEYEVEQKNLQKNIELRSTISLMSTGIDALVNKLQNDLTTCVDKLKKARERREELKASGIAKNQQAEATRKEWEGINQNVSQKDAHVKQSAGRLEQNQEQLQGIYQELGNEQIRLLPILPDLAQQLTKAIEDTQCFEKLNEMSGGYQQIALENNELRQAELGVQSHELLLQREQEELSVCLAIAGEITSLQAEKDYKDAEMSYRLAQSQLNVVTQELGKIQRDNAAHCDLRAKLAQVQQQKWAFGQIELALKRGTKTQEAGPLMQQITNKLMYSISNEASRTLEKLGWHMSVEYEEKTGFQVRDRATSVTRRYQEYSGGEQFAVAIAVALAVSRVTNKSSYIRCLFIDEGFGALDGKHRKRIVNDAIGMLIERGMRDQVVVITHIEDMQEYFPHRIELKKQDDYSVLATEQEVTL